jgi:hypothetical protein
VFTLVQKFFSFSKSNSDNRENLWNIIGGVLFLKFFGGFWE